MLIRGFINLYRSGFYHRAGKPNAYNVHAGDVYADYHAAVAAAAADPAAAFYLGTVPTVWHSMTPEPINPPDSTPRKLDRALEVG